MVKLTQAQLEVQIEEAEGLVPPGTKVHHVNDSDTIYIVMGYVLREEDLMTLVMYARSQPVEGQQRFVHWTRPMPEFLDRFVPITLGGAG